MVVASATKIDISPKFDVDAERNIPV